MGSSDGVAPAGRWCLLVELKVLASEPKDEDIKQQRRTLVERIMREFQRETLPMVGSSRRLLPPHRAFVFLDCAKWWRDELQVFDQAHGLLGQGIPAARTVEIDFDSSEDVADLMRGSRTEPSREELLRKLRKRQT